VWPVDSVAANREVQRDDLCRQLHFGDRRSRDITVTVTANPWTALGAPTTGTSVNHTFTIAGWAADLAAGRGTGVSVVHVYALPNPGSGTPAFNLGAATDGSSRPDVGAYFGSQFEHSGYALTTTLSPGVYMLTAYAYSTVTNTWSAAQSVTVTVATSNPLIAIDTPAASATVGQPFTVAGWAIDTGAPSGSGMQWVDVYALPSGGSGMGTHVGGAAPTGSRPDVGAYYGAPFTNSGYSVSVSGLAPGTYTLNVFALSTVSGQWSLQQRTVTVQ
jgi:hypothetical protein